MLRAAVPARLLGGSEAVYVATNASVGASVGGVAGAILAVLLERGRGAAARARGGRRAEGSRGRAQAARGGRSRPHPLGEPPRGRGAVGPGVESRAQRPRTIPRSPARRRGAPSMRTCSPSAGPRLAEELRAAGGTPAVLSALAKAGLVSAVETERRVDLARHVGAAGADRRPAPTPAQAERSRRSPRPWRPRTGPTSSSSTASRAAARPRSTSPRSSRRSRAGRRGILLVPEIALAPALVRRLVARFGEPRLAPPQRPVGRRAGG